MKWDDEYRHERPTEKHGEGARTAKDGTDLLCEALYGRPAKPQDYLGGSNARMLNDAAHKIIQLEAAQSASGALELVRGHPCGRFYGVTAQDCAERRARERIHEPRCSWCDCTLAALSSGSAGKGEDGA